MSNQPPFGGSGERPESNQYGQPEQQPGQPGPYGQQGPGQYGQPGQAGQPGQPGQGQPGQPGQHGQQNQPGQPGPQGQPTQHAQSPYGAGPAGAQQGRPPGYPPFPSSSGANPSPPPSNPLTALFDFGFNQFVTPYVVKFLYILLTAVLVIGWIGVVIAGFTQGIGVGLLALVGGALAFLIYLTLIRVTLEFYYAVVRMSEDIHHRR
ncbi:DUF4282 domain-containing protein [Pseudonocardia sp. C8]|uniref:DUF4282 domain-containing protein n=1 Tax=Pseudonocardia sp. C8 TaxID=2762759 RepID=UPI001642643E|nr:DUF4282 domain-containing protein [Pseudonocardia sp. C8]MBC3192591.1 DUF4282 domain-containing protein [Pseudonocardia sp. C8]